MINGSLKKLLNSGHKAFGMMLSEIYVPNITRIIAGCGFDFLLIDCEHGYFDFTQVANIIAVAEGARLPIIVRVTQPSRTSITKYLDMGADGILLSDVANSEEAALLADLCLYAPKGNRGVSTYRAHTGYQNNDTKALMQNANESILVICQIESLDAVNDIDNILAIDGIDGVIIGPNDLTQHMNVFEQYLHPEVDKILCKVYSAAKASGKWSGIITSNQDLLLRCFNIGMMCFSVGSELNALSSGLSMLLDKIKEVQRQSEEQHE